MRNIFTVIIFVVSLSNFAFSQKIIDVFQPEIIKNGTGLSNNDQAFAVCNDSEGNIYQLGIFEGELIFGTNSLISVGKSNLFVAKVNPNGSWDWAVSTNASSIISGKSIACDSDGNILVTGYFYDECSFGTHSISSNANSELFVAKLSNTGEWQWAKSGNGFGFNRANSIICDNSNNVYVTGSFELSISLDNKSLISSGGKDIFVAKYNSSGVCQWAINAGGANNDEALGISYHPNQSFISATGYFSGTVTIGDSVFTSLGNKDIFVAGMDLNGNWIWANKAGSTGADEARAIAMDRNGNSIITGFYSKQASFGSINLASPSNRNILAAKIDNSGSWVWASNSTGSGSNEANSISMDNSGNAFIVGSFYSDIKFANTQLNSLNDRNLFLTRVSSNGVFNWTKSILGNSSIDGFGVTVNQNANVILVGGFFKDAIISGDTLFSKGGSDILVADFALNGTYNWAISKASIVSVLNIQQSAVDLSGNIFHTGYYQGTVKFGNDTISSIGSYDLFVAKVSSDGTWQKVKSFGSMGDDRSNTIAIDTSGNVYIAGYYSGDISFSNISLTNNGFSDIFIAKFDNSLDIEWAKGVGDTDFDFAKKIAFKDDYIVVSGIYTKKPYFGNKRLSARGYDDIFLTKLDLDGNFIWTTTAGGSFFDNINGLAIDDDGNIIITGSFENSCYFDNIKISSSGGDDIFIAKADENGSWEWAISAGSGASSEFGAALAVDENNDIFVTGNYRELSFFGTNYLMSKGNSDMFLAKVDKNSDWLWVKSIGGIENDNAKDIEIVNNSIQIIGNTSSNFIIDSVNFVANGKNGNAFIASFDFDGGILWSICDEANATSSFNSITKGDSNNAIVCGTYYKKFLNKDNKLLAKGNGDLNSFYVITGFTLEKPKWEFRDSTGLSSTIKIPSSIMPKVNGRDLLPGDAIGVFYIRNSNYYCAGMEYYTGNDIEIKVSGNDPNTPLKDGFNQNEKYNIIVWDAIRAEEVPTIVRYSIGPDNFSDEAYSEISQLPIIYDTLRVNLKAGWNMISSRVLPVAPSMTSIFSPIKSKIAVVKDVLGSIYFPEFNINTLGDWNIAKGYLIFAKEATTVEFIGDYVELDELTLNLSAGWNFLPNLLSSEMNIELALSSLVSNNVLVLAKDINGLTYMPEFNINILGNLKLNNAYSIYLNSAIQFKFNSND